MALETFPLRLGEATQRFERNYGIPKIVPFRVGASAWSEDARRKREFLF